MQSFIRESGLRKGLDGVRAGNVWDSVAGPQAAAATTRKTFSNGELTVFISSSVVRSSLRFRLPQIISSMNAILGEGTVRYIHLK